MVEVFARAREKEGGGWEVVCPVCKTVITLSSKPGKYDAPIECPQCKAKIRVI